VVLAGRDVARLPALVETARRTRRVMRQNLGWAIAYNGLALPLAALGFVAPWLAALGMAASSLVVTLNALRLARPVRRRGAGNEPQVQRRLAGASA
jgi:Cu2+-exporting ATPase